MSAAASAEAAARRAKILARSQDRMKLVMQQSTTLTQNKPLTDQLTNTLPSTQVHADGDSNSTNITSPEAGYSTNLQHLSLSTPQPSSSTNVSTIIAECSTSDNNAKVLPGAHICAMPASAPASAPALAPPVVSSPSAVSAAVPSSSSSSASASACAPPSSFQSSTPLHSVGHRRNGFSSVILLFFSSALNSTTFLSIALAFFSSFDWPLVPVFIGLQWSEALTSINTSAAAVFTAFFMLQLFSFSFSFLFRLSSSSNKSSSLLSSSSNISSSSPTSNTANIEEQDAQFSSIFSSFGLSETDSKNLQAMLKSFESILYILSVFKQLLDDFCCFIGFSLIIQGAKQLARSA